MSEIIKSFSAFSKNSDALSGLRREAIESFDKLGFPTTKHEEWKYTNLKDVVTHALAFSGFNGTGKTTADQIKSFMIAGADAHILVFENGLYNEKLSSGTLDASGVKVLNLASAMELPEVKQHLGRVASFENESFVALNTAYIQDGVFIHLGKKAEAPRNIHIIYINTSEDAGNVYSVRNLVVAEEGSRAIITESYHSLNGNCSGITNSVTEVVVGKNANVELVKAQLESDKTNHISFTQAIQERDSIFDTVTVTLGGQLVRNNLHIKLNDVNCTSHLFGLYIADGEQLIDNHTLVDHAKPNCFSNELYKGIIDDKASGVFNGKIFVRQDAQKTNAYQSNKNILLSNDAQMNTKPQLEIFADDVKCTHGATTGQLDEEALFYLRARGIGEQSARTLLNIAFVADVLNNIKSEELRNNLQSLAEAKLMN